MGHDRNRGGRRWARGRGRAVAARIVPVIMSGGAGSRLWPVSTDARPKQFQGLDEAHSLIQATALRFRGGEGVEFLPPVIVCNARHEALVREQLAAVGVAPSAIVLEPCGRNTAAVAAVAALAVAEVAPGALALLTPADHVVRRPEALREAIAAAAQTAFGRIVTFGIRPTGPATGYGYIRRAEALDEGVFRIARFLEKPPLEDAVRYVAEGGYDWNAGIFLFAPEVMAEAQRACCPEVWGAAETAFLRAARTGEVVALDGPAFEACPSISVDHAVMERTDRSAVAPCDPAWSDIGSWNELWRHLPHDAHGNAVREGVAVDCENTLVWSSGDRPVAVVGLSDVLVVSTEEGVLVVARDRDQDVRKVHQALARLAEPEAEAKGEG